MAQAASGQSGATQALTAEREHSQFPAVFLGYIARFFVLAEADELGMSQPVSVGPFEEFDLDDRFWPQPHRLLHLFRAQFLAESGAVRLWQIHERAERRHKVL